MHVHVHRENGEAKFWLEPKIELARNFGLTERQIASALRIIQKREHGIRSAWQEHFGR